MLSLLTLLTMLWPISFALIFTALIGVGTFFIGVPITEKLYINLLLRIFSYAASTIEEDEQLYPETGNSPTSNAEEQNFSLIEREVILNENGMQLQPRLSMEACLYLHAPLVFVKSGVEAIIEDEVTHRFTSAELKVWNLLSRTHRYQHINLKLTILWVVGFLIRYFVLLPVRLLIAITAVWLLASTNFCIAFVTPVKLRRSLYKICCRMCLRLFMRSFSACIQFHHPENRPKSDGICVANHTTPIDVIILGCDNVYAMVGQHHSGFFGWMEQVFSWCESHIWFERGEVRDRQLVAARIRAHVEDPDKLPILVFPEGTCINNTSVMMFKKGSFEVGAVIYPVAIKYDGRFADCFWNSSKYGMIRYLLMMMTSWAIKADVWYLPPERQLPSETSIEFANRVKRKIAIQGGLVDLQWDGGLKRSPPPEGMKHAQQASFFKFIKDA